MTEFTWPTLPVEKWIDDAVRLFADETRAFFRAVRWPATLVLNYIESALLAAHPALILVLAFALLWQFANLRVAVFTVAALTFLGFIGAWPATLTTAALIVAAI